MASSKMSLGNAISMTFLFVSFVTGIADTVGKHAELAIHSPADVAHIRQFGSKIHSHNPEWLSKGMGIFGYSFLGWLWRPKEVITWAFTQKSTHLEEEVVDEIFAAAFAKWDQVCVFTFARVDADEEPDIRVEIGQPEDDDCPSETLYDLTGGKIDTATIQVEDRNDYMSATNETGWINLRFIALFEIGQALGLGDSDDREAIMCRKSIPERMRSTDDPQLSQDDKDGIKARYENATSDEKPKASSSRLPRTCRECVKNFGF